MPYPKISIVIPTFNSEKYIVDCIESIVHQTYTNKEVWFIDGASTDNTISIIKEFANQYSYIQYISEKDNGIYNAMNKGIDKCMGDYIYFLGSDDVFHNTRVLEDVFCSNNHSGFDLIYGKIYLNLSKRVYGRVFTINDFKADFLCHQAVFTKKKIFTSVGKFDTSYKISADQVFLIQCYKNESISKIFVDTVICNYSEEGISNKEKDYKFIKNKYSLFNNLSFIEKIKKYYFKIRPKWFVPSKLFKY